MSNDHVTIDALAGQIKVSTEHLYQLLIDWHRSEDEPREEAVALAQRFLLRLADGNRWCAHRDEAAAFAAQFLDPALPGVRNELNRITNALDEDDDDLDAEREWTLNTDPKFDDVDYPQEDQ